MRILIRLVPAALLGIVAAALVSCGSSGKGLIPSANAGPLRNDFEAVTQAAESGNGSCAKTESALGKTEQDFLALPVTVDRGLHARLQQGIANLHKQALAMCQQLAPTATSTTSNQTSTPPTTSGTTSTETTSTSTSTTTTPPTSSQTTSTTTTPPSQSGGTEAREAEEGPGKGKGEGKDKAKTEGEGNGGASAGGASPGGGQ